MYTSQLRERNGHSMCVVFTVLDISMRHDPIHQAKGGVFAFLCVLPLGQKVAKTKPSSRKEYPT